MLQAEDEKPWTYGEDVVLGDSVHREVGGDLTELVVQDGGEVDVESVALRHGFCGPAQKVQEPLPVPRCLVHVPQQEACKGELKFTEYILGAAGELPAERSLRGLAQAHAVPAYLWWRSTCWESVGSSEELVSVLALGFISGR